MHKTLYSLTLMTLMIPLALYAGGNFQGTNEEPQQFNEERGNEGPEQDFVEPQQIRDALRQIKDVQREIKQVMKSARKISGLETEVMQLNELSSQLSEFEGKLKNSPVDRETMSEFWDARLWDTFNVIRIRIELPKEIKRMERDLKRLDKLIVRVAKYPVEGLDMSQVKIKIDEVKNSIAQGKVLLEQGEYEDAQESMQVIYDGAHPGDIMGVLEQLYNAGRTLQKIKSNDVKQEIHGLLESIIESANNGDFREANFMFNEISMEFWKTLEKIKRKPVVNEDFRKKMKQLEERMTQRLQEEEQKHQEGEPQSNLMPYKPYQSASLIDNVYWNLRNFIGF